MSNAGEQGVFCRCFLPNKARAKYAEFVLSSRALSGTDLFMEARPVTGQKSDSSQSLPSERNQQLTDTRVIISDEPTCLAAVRSAKGSEMQAASVTKKS